MCEPRKVRGFNSCIALGFFEKIKTLRGCVLQMSTLLSTKHPFYHSHLSQDYLKTSLSNQPCYPFTAGVGERQDQKLVFSWLYGEAVALGDDWDETNPW